MCLLSGLILDWVNPLQGFFRISLWSRRIEDLELKTLETGSVWVGLVWMRMGGILLSFLVQLKFTKIYFLKFLRQVRDEAMKFYFIVGMRTPLT